MDELTEKQNEVLAFIRERIAGEGLPPSVREIARRFGYKSPKAAADHIDALIRKGYLARAPGTARGLRVLTGGLAEDQAHSPAKGIPIVGDVAAGIPVLAVENAIGTLSLDTAFGSGELFAVRVRGDSMVDFGIFEGDLVIVRRSPVVTANAIAVAYIDGEATVKMFRKTDTGYDLVPGNARYQTIHVTRQTPGFALAGPVVGVVRKM